MTPDLAAISPKQHLSMVKSTARINLWTGAIRSGKTISSLLRWLQYVANEAPQSGVLFMVGQTKDTINRNLFEPLQDPAIYGPLSRFVHYVPGSDFAWIMGRKVFLVGANDVKAFRRIRGSTCAGAYVDEVTLLPPNFLTELLGRMSLKGAKMFGTTNPDGPAHWLKVEYIDRARELGIRHFTFTLDDNPSLDPEYVESIKREHSGLWYQRLILGKWVAAEGIVYDAWSPEAHVVRTMPRIDRWFSVGLDYGTTNPLDAILLGRGTDEHGVTRIYAGSEWRHDPKVAKIRLTDAQHSSNLQEWLQQTPREDGSTERGVRPDFICVDPSAASFMEQLMADRVHGLAPADNHVLDGIRTVSSLIAMDRLRVHESCKPLISELSSYSWDDKATEKGEDKPMKVADHAVDALRYGIHTTQTLWRPHIGRLTHAAA
ncbi:PBSX family phage terminase large subunit [Nocardioides sp. R1-1]|uniref:PBSX family phage terminase large subunit n=1 Tax=Nocardioides sp. R1-1 TaxID=3383502 RepID=UPI0038CF6A05